jgi:hypothetical protein
VVAVEADEGSGGEFVKETFEGAADDAAAVVVDDFEVIAIGGDGADGFDGDEAADAALFDFERTFAGDVFGWTMENFAGAGDGSSAAFFVDGFEKVVGGANFEGADGKLGVGGGEDDAGAVGVESFEGGEAIGAGKVDVEEDEVGCVACGKLPGGGGVAGGGGEADAFDGGENLFEVPAGGGFVVNDEGGKGLHF